MNLNNKANTLKKLRINGAIIPKLKIYKVKKFLQNNKFILNDIKNRFDSKVAIRSSAFDEDQPNKSNAGKFESFLNINPKNLKDTNIKIKKVINSYKTRKKGSEFFVQNPSTFDFLTEFNRLLENQGIEPPKAHLSSNSNSFCWSRTRGTMMP